VYVHLFEDHDQGCVLATKHETEPLVMLDVPLTPFFY